MSDAGNDASPTLVPGGALDPQTLARANGYSWQDIDDHVAQATDAAMQYGYSQGDVDQHLGYQDPSNFKDRARSSWTATMAADPKILDGLAAPQPELDLTASPTLASDYANAVQNREVKGPLDFADHYAAAALSAAHDVLGLDDSNLDDVRARQSAGAQAADALAPSLPSTRDLTDAGLSLGGAFDQTRQNLLDHWQDTGQPPLDAAVKANADPELAAKLTAMFGGYNPETDAGKARDAIQKFYFVPGEELVDAKSVREALTDAGIDVATVAGLNVAGKYVVGPLLRLAARKLGEIPGWLADLAGKAPTDVVDLTKPPGEAITQKPVTEAFAAPKAAERQPAPVPAEGAAAPEGPQPFVPDASPAEKIEALSRLELENRTTGPMPHLESGRFFQDLLEREGVTDAPTQALAAGHDTTASWLKWMGDVWHDQSGTLAIPEAPTELQAGSRRATILGKNTAEDLIRRVSTGLGTQKSEALAQGFEGFFKDLAPFMPRWKAELEKPYGGGAMDTEIGQLLDALEGHGAVAPDGPFAPYAKARAAAHEKNVADLQAAVDRGEMNPVQLRDFYISHIYTPESISNVDRGVTGGGNRTGSLGFMKQRSIPTYREALAEGYKPKYDNPILMDIAGIDAQQKALATLRMQAMAKETNWMRYYTDPREAARDGFERIYGLNSEKIASTVEKETGEAGAPAVQRLYSPKGFSAIWNNWTQFENLQRNATVARIEDALLKVKNGSTYMKLLFPGYHTITEYKEGLANALANALDEATGGEVGRGVWDLAKLPLKPAEYVLKAGRKWRPMYRAMQADPALDAFVAGGGNIARRSRVYAASDTPTLWRLWQRGGLAQALGDDFHRVLARDLAGEGAKRAAAGVMRGLNLPFREIGRFATSVTAPVWDHFVPLLKAGAAIERIQTFIRQNPTASDDVVRNYARRVVTNIEDRFGEYNSANLFWHPAVKRAANQSMLSTGWTYGTVHATLSGLGYNLGRGFEWNPVATTNLAAQVAMIALTNAAWSYLVDGKLPSSTLDYLIPFANARGIARILLPGEEKEYYDWMKVAAETFSAYRDKGLGAGLQQSFQSTKDYALGKLAPIWRAAHDWVTGEDAIGHKIAYTPGGIGKWLENEFLPIFATNADQAQKAGLNPVENLFGLRAAPKWFANWDQWRAGQQRLHNAWTREELQRARREDADRGEAFAPFAGSRGGGAAGDRTRFVPGYSRTIGPGRSAGGLYIAPPPGGSRSRGSQGGDFSNSGGVQVLRGGSQERGQQRSVFDQLRSGGQRSGRQPSIWDQLRPPRGETSQRRRRR